jgi:hypothetical protein
LPYDAVLKLSSFFKPNTSGLSVWKNFSVVARRPTDTPKALMWLTRVTSRLYVDWGSRFVGDVNRCSVVGTGLSGPTLSVL